MTDLADPGQYAALLHDEIGLPLTERDLDLGWDEIDGWDSLHLLTLATLLQRETGRSASLAQVLEAGSLNAVLELFTVAAR